jgi:hypothetical protein
MAGKIIGLAIVATKAAGPIHEYVEGPGVVVADKVTHAPEQIVELGDTVTVGIGLTVIV